LRTRSLEAILRYNARCSEGDTGALTEDTAGVATNRFVLGKWLFFSTRRGDLVPIFDSKRLTGKRTTHVPQELFVLTSAFPACSDFWRRGLSYA
jgi:hypothetical protein